MYWLYDYNHKQNDTGFFSLRGNASLAAASPQSVAVSLARRIRDRIDIAAMLIEHLQKTFKARTQKNPAYSLRSFARSIEIDSSTLSAILRRKRPLSLKTARHILEKLEINDPEKVRRLLLGSITDAAQLSSPNYHELDLAHAEMVSEWEHTAILEATDLTNFQSSKKNLAVRLGIPFAITSDCVDRLVLLGLLHEQEGIYKKSKTNASTPTNLPSQKLRQGHRQLIEKGLDALDNLPVHVRDISGITMAINSRRLDEAKLRIQRFRREISAFLEEGPRDAVYCLNVQLFPLDQGGK